MNRYAAKLLFQFRVDDADDSRIPRLCEERVVLFRARSANDALKSAKRYGRRSQHKYPNDRGKLVHFEFIGVMELIRLGPECGPDEVWYELKRRQRPAERKNRLIPRESKLQAIHNGE